MCTPIQSKTLSLHCCLVVHNWNVVEIEGHKKIVKQTLQKIKTFLLNIKMKNYLSIIVY